MASLPLIELISATTTNIQRARMQTVAIHAMQTWPSVRTISSLSKTPKDTAHIYGEITAYTDNKCQNK